MTRDTRDMEALLSEGGYERTLDVIGCVAMVRGNQTTVALVTACVRCAAQRWSAVQSRRAASARQRPKKALRFSGEVLPPLLCVSVAPLMPSLTL